MPFDSVSVPVELPASTMPGMPRRWRLDCGAVSVTVEPPPKVTVPEETMVTPLPVTVAPLPIETLPLTM